MLRAISRFKGGSTPKCELHCLLRESQNTMSVEEHTPTLEGSRDVAAPVEIPKIKAMIVDANGLIKVCCRKLGQRKMRQPF